MLVFINNHSAKGWACKEPDSGIGPGSPDSCKNESVLELCTQVGE